MAPYRFSAPYALNYTEGRDLSGRNLGLVQPGDIRDLEKPPDHHWREATDEDRAALAARQAAEAEPGQAGTEAGSDSGQQDQDEGKPSGQDPPDPGAQDTPPETPETPEPEPGE